MKVAGQMLLCLLPVVAGAATLSLTDVQGRSTEAEILSLEHGLLTIRRAADGKVFSLPVERLDEASRQRVAEAAPPPKPTPPPVEKTPDLVENPDQPARPKPRGLVPPVYPKELREKGVTGEVVVTLVVDENGRVASAKVLKSTNPGFEKPALDAVARWRFQPALKDGTPVRTRVEAPIIFNID